MLQSHCETTASALSICKTTVQAQVGATNAVGEEQVDDDTADFDPFFDRLDTLISYARGAKVIAGKAYRELSDLRARSLGLNPSHLQMFTLAESQASQIASFARSSGHAIGSLSTSDEVGDVSSLTPRDITRCLKDCATTAFELKQPESETFVTVSSALRALTEQLNHLGSIAGDLGETQEFILPPAPWLVRSDELKRVKLTTVDDQAEIARLTETVKERTLLIRQKEHDNDEQGVRIELLEARMKDAKARTGGMEKMEAEVKDMKAGEKKAREETERHKSDASRLRRERDELRRRVDEISQDGRKGAGEGEAFVLGGASRVEVDRERGRVKGLQAVIRYLTQEKEKLSKLPRMSVPAKSASPRTRAGQADSDMSWLNEPLLQPRSSKVQRADAVLREGRVVFTELLTLTTSTPAVNLSELGSGDRLRWRPARETSSWQAQKRREEWEQWCQWRDEVKSKAETLERPRANNKHGPDKTKIRMAKKNSNLAGEVHIVGEADEGKAVM